MEALMVDVALAVIVLVIVLVGAGVLRPSVRLEITRELTGRERKKIKELTGRLQGNTDRLEEKVESGART